MTAPRYTYPMRCALASLLCLAGWIGCAEPSDRERAADDTAAEVAPSATRRVQPKPGERVRQPELDGYCAEPERGGAYYYHGGSPVARLAREDGCAPLYISECADQGRCYAPRDQEPGMWCCAQPDEQAEARATR